MEGNNSYWEQVLTKQYSTATEEDILARIKKSQFVIDKLEKDELWKILLEDVNKWVDNLDSNWQYTYDDKLYEMRVLKHACMHLKNLKDGYVTDYKFAIEELKRRQDPDIIERDMEN